MISKYQSKYIMYVCIQRGGKELRVSSRELTIQNRKPAEDRKAIYSVASRKEPGAPGENRFTFDSVSFCRSLIFINRNGVNGPPLISGGDFSSSTTHVY